MSLRPRNYSVAGKDHGRNLIIHPEISLTPDEALSLFEIAQGAIMAMAETLPIPKPANTTQGILVGVAPLIPPG